MMATKALVHSLTVSESVPAFLFPLEIPVATCSRATAYPLRRQSESRRPAHQKVPTQKQSQGDAEPQRMPVLHRDEPSFPSNRSPGDKEKGAPQ